MLNAKFNNQCEFVENKNKFLSHFEFLLQVVLDEGSQPFPVKSYIINTYDFVGYIVPDAASQLCHVKAATDNT